MSLPPRPSDPLLVRGPLLYVFGVAPDTLTPHFQHVIAIVDRWLDGSDDPVPEPDPPPPPCPKPPDPDPPPVPAYPLLGLLNGLAEMDAATMLPMWDEVRLSISDWTTTGPFA
jgi:hypothetical protein